MLEWREASINANIYKRVAKEMETYMLWGANDMVDYWHTHAY